MSSNPTINRLAVTTPELVTFHYRTAGLASRALAWLIDQCQIIALRIVLFIVLIRLAEYGIAIFLALMLLIDFGYFTWFEWRRNGQTPGKKYMGIHVVCISGASLRPGDVLLRNLLRVLDSLPVLMLVGGITAFIDPLRRRLGDMAAGTAVVHAPQAQLPSEMFNADNRQNSYWADPAVRNRINARVTREERDLLMDLAMRRDQLDPLPRQELFSQALAYFSRRYSLPQVDHLTDEQAVLNVAMVVRQQRGLGR